MSRSALLIKVLSRRVAGTPLVKHTEELCHVSWNSLYIMKVDTTLLDRSMTNSNPAKLRSMDLLCDYSALYSPNFCPHIKYRSHRIIQPQFL